MSIHSSSRRTPGTGIFAPLNIAAYIAWIAVAGETIWNALRHGVSTAPQALTLCLLLLFLTALGSRAVFEGRPKAVKYAPWMVVVQVLLAPLCVNLLGDPLQAVLLVVAAAQAGAFQRRRWIYMALIIANVALIVWLLHTQPFAKAIQISLAYIAFQLFAGLVIQAAYTHYELQQKVELTNRELLATRVLVAEGARVQERLRVSRDLHDIAGHKLTALKLQLSVGLRNHAVASSQILERCFTLADELLTDIRSIVSTLRDNERIDLRQALIALDPGIPDINIVFAIEPDMIILDIEKAETLLRCAQEGITNALRHGHASEIKVVLQQSAVEVTLTVEDDGDNLIDGNIKFGHGLIGLQERLQQIDGSLTLQHRLHPRGCLLTAVLPNEVAAC
jgi:signal transduction histidine kinase